MKRRKERYSAIKLRFFSETIQRQEHAVTCDALQAVQESEPVADLAAAELAAGQFLQALGVQLDSESLRGTPARMARAYAELFTPRPFDLTTFPTTRATTSLCSLAISRCGPCVSITCCRSPGPRTSGTCQASAFSGFPSWPASSSTSPADPRCRKD